MVRRPRRILTISAVAACLALVVADSASAQNSPTGRRGLEVGVKGGLSVTRLQFSGGDDLFESERGVTAGVYVTRDLFSVFGLTVEALFSRKGATDIVIANSSEDATVGRITIDYVEMPLLLQVDRGTGASSRVYGFVGPALGLRLRARFGETDVTDNYERLDWSLVGGGGAALGRYLVEVRVTWGLHNVAVDLVGFGPDTITNRSVSILGGFRLR